MEKTAMAKQFVVIFRTGGTVNYKWQRSLSFTSYDAAITARNETERMGYPAHIEDMGLSYAIGLPDTFTYEKL